MEQESPQHLQHLEHPQHPGRRGETAGPAAGGDAAAIAGGHGATAVPGQLSHVSHDRRARRRLLAGGLLGALGVTAVSAVFIACFIGGLHAPGPRSVPIGFVGTPAGASSFSAGLSHQAPGAFTLTSFPSAGAALTAIGNRSIDAALVTGPAVQNAFIATAVSQAETNAILKVLQAGAARAHLPLAVHNIRPLHPGDPQGLSQLFFVVAMLAPSLAFGNLLINRIGTRLNEFWHLAMITAYALIVAAVATAVADAWIGALTGAPWAIFGVGTLMAFTAAVMGAAAARWAGGLGYLVLLLLFVPVGISASGSTLGPRMITQWYADVGSALPPGSTQSTVRNVTYFNGNAITDPLLIVSAWALAGVVALILAALLHPPMRGRSGQQPDAARPQNAQRQVV